MSEAGGTGAGPEPTVPDADLARLRRRAELLGQVRAFLTDRGYWEVDTPLLSADTCVDAHVEPFEVAAGPRRLFLQTSPEFGMKRLLTAGAGSIFQITHAFRAAERGRLHNPEFTLVEWYRVGGCYRELMDEVGELVSGLLDLPPAGRTSYQAAFLQYVGCDPLTADCHRLRRLAAQHGLEAAGAERDELLNFLLATLVEPQLGADRPQFLFDYPASQAALARLQPGPPPLAERFELYVSGMELCNGFQELTDAAELRARFETENARRVRMGKKPLPVDSHLLRAVQGGLPPCAGVALGFDRLVMLATGAQQIDQVLAFPFERA